MSGARPSEQSAAGGALGANTTADSMTITGAANIIVRVLFVYITYAQTTAALVEIQLRKRSSAYTGGTSATATNIPHDSNDVAGSATVRHYSAAPTGGGTLVGLMRNTLTLVNPAAVVTYPTEWDLRDDPIMLRGAAEVLGVGTAAGNAGVSQRGGFVWTEERDT